MSKITDFSRQMDLVNPFEFNTEGLPIHIIGAGATGSWVALTLAKLGFDELCVYDFDVVEEHNLPNQCYGIADIGQNKAQKTAVNIKRASDIDIKYYDTKVGLANIPQKGVVFLLTDTMKSRKTIAKSLLAQGNISLLIETRMGLDEGQIYTTDPQNIDDVKRYLETLNFSDDEAFTSACGTSQSVITTALMVTSIAVRQFIKFVNHEETDNEIHFGLDDVGILKI